MTSPVPSNYRLILLALLLALAAAGLIPILKGLGYHPAGIDFLAFWAGGRAALDDPSRIYDFAHVTALQGIDFGPGVLRPYINPPSALLLFAPLASLPFWTGYPLLMLAGLAMLLLAARRVGAPWWLVALPMIPFTLFCGQVTLLIGGLVLLGLSLRARPWLAGLCFALAGVIKPQILLLLPLALAAQGAWLTIVATCVLGLLFCGLSALVFGIQVWFDWLHALPRFSAVVMGNRELLEHAITPHAWLVVQGWNGAWAWLLAPFAAWGVWAAFRHERPWFDQLLALLGGGLLISPYAMNYELALLAPAVAAYLARTDDRRWMAYAALAAIHAVNGLTDALALLAALALPLIGTPLRHISLARTARDR
jgi:hypothetical protein